MEEFKKTIYVKAYKAVDGTEFDSKEECLKYEKSALGVIKGKFSKLIVGEADAWKTMGGYDDHKVVAVKPSSQKDIDTILQFVYLEQPYYLDECRKAWRENFENILLMALGDNDTILFGLNCEEEYYFINSLKNITNNLNKLCYGELG